MAGTVVTSSELRKVLDTAAQVAEFYKEELNSLHILIAILSVHPNNACSVLKEAGLILKRDKQGKSKLPRVDEEEASLGARSRSLAGKLLAPEKKSSAKAILDLREELLAMSKGKLVEPPDTMKVIEAKAYQLAAAHRTNIVDTLFYLQAICRIRKTLGFRAIELAGVPIPRILASISQKITRQRPTRPLPPVNPDGLPLSPEDEDDLAIDLDGEELTPLPEPTSTPTAPVTPTLAAPPVQPRIRPAAPPPPPPCRDKARDQGDETPFDLDENEYPLLFKMSRNLTRQALLGDIDPVIGRRAEIQQMMQILLKRRTNNPCLVGEPGVGKTALVEGLALAIAQEEQEISKLGNRIILELETAGLVAGTSLRGSFSERMIQLREEVKKGKDQIIVFIDEIHTMVGAGAGESALDAANELKAALARGDFPCIGATTLDEYKKYIESDKALERRFQPVVIKEPSEDEAAQIIRGIISFYEEHHGVEYTDKAITSAVRLSVKYINDRFLPDKAIDLLDTSGASCALAGNALVDEELVAEVLSAKVGIPVEKLLLTAANRYNRLLDFLGDQIVGHQDNLRKIADGLKRGFAGFSSDRPLATFLLAGPSGVGKSETARALNRFLFDNDSALREFEGAEYTEGHAVAKLIGTSPGYVGHEQGGQLTSAMYRKPFQILVFKDFNQAHAEVQDVITRLLQSGSLVDGKGRRVSFSNAVVILTIQLPQDVFEETTARSVGFAPVQASQSDSPEEREKRIWEKSRTTIPLKLRSSVDVGLLYNPLTQDDAVEVARKLIRESSDRLLSEQDISFTLSEEALGFLVKSGGYVSNEGAKPMRRTIQALVENRVAEMILDSEVVRGSRITVFVQDEELRFFVRRPEGITASA